MWRPDFNKFSDAVFIPPKENYLTWIGPTARIRNFHTGCIAISILNQPSPCLKISLLLSPLYALISLPSLSFVIIFPFRSFFYISSGILSAFANYHILTGEKRGKKKQISLQVRDKCIEVNLSTCTPFNCRQISLRNCSPLICEMTRCQATGRYLWTAQTYTLQTALLLDPVHNGIFRRMSQCEIWLTDGARWTER